MQKSAAGRGVPTTEESSIRLSRQDLEELLRELDRMETKKKVRRAFTRLRYSQALARVKVQQSGAVLLMAVRNISRGGMGLLHCAYMHVGTACTLTLQSPDGAGHEVRAKVVHCRHVRGRVHEIGMAFDDQVMVRRFIVQDATREQYSLETFDASQMKGGALLLSACPFTRRMTEHWLRQTRVTLSAPPSLDEAYDAAKAGHDVILLDFDAHGFDAAEFADQLRLDGIRAPIIVLSGDTSPESKRPIAAIRGAGFLAKPLSEPALLRALAEFLVLGERAEALPVARPEKIRVAAGLESVIAEFAKELKNMAGELRKAIASENLDAFAGTCTHIRSVAPVLGFGEIAATAEAALTAARRCASLEDARREAYALVALCERAQQG